MRFLLFLLMAIPAEARVFNLQNESFAPYFRGSIGLSSLGESAYSHSSGANTLFDESPEYNYSGEAGFLFTSKYVGLTLGVEFFTSQNLTAQGSTSSGTILMDLDSKIKATILKAGVLVYYMSAPSHRAYVAINAGYANVKMLNEYELTATGTSAYGMTEASEKAVAQTVMGELLYGFEFNLADVSTMLIEGGYRYFRVNTWEYDQGGTNFLGSYNDGDEVLNHDGTKRTSNLGGWVLAIGFRFYID